MRCMERTLVGLTGIALVVILGLSAASGADDSKARIDRRIREAFTPGREGSDDPFYVSAEQRKAAGQLPVGFAAELTKLLSDDLDVFFMARRKVIAQGPAAYAAVADLARKVQPQDRLLQMRLASVLSSLHLEQFVQNQARVVEGAFRRTDELRKKNPEKKIAVLVSRMVTRSGLVAHTREFGYGDTCCFSFPKVTHGFYGGMTSLELDNGGIDGNDKGLDLIINLRGLEANQLQDLGPVDFASVKNAPAVNSPSWDKQLYPPAIAGHVYLEHCFEDRGGRGNVDVCVKFKVLEAKPREYVILEWETIPQDK